LSQGVAIPAILAAYVRKEVFVYTLAQLVELFHAFPAILGTACYFLHIFWVVNGMYIIYFFSDVGIPATNLQKGAMYQWMHGVMVWMHGFIYTMELGFHSSRMKIIYYFLYRDS